MKTPRYSLMALSILVSILLASCQPAPVAEIPPPAQTAIPAATATSTPLPTPTQTASPTPAPIPTETPVPIPCTIAFDTDRDGNREVYRMGPDGKDPVNLSQNPGEDRNPSFSADGSQIAFVSSREGEPEGGPFIYIMDANGRDVRRLTDNPQSDLPDWSHDSNWIVFTSQDDIFVIPADGNAAAINLTNSPEKDTMPSWSPDDSQIVWLSGEDWNWNIFVMEADGSNIRQLTQDGKVNDVKWSVDGRLFTHWDNQEAGCFNCIMDADGSNISDAGGKGEIQQYLPFWMLDGNRVECVAGDLNGKDNEIYLVGEIFPDIFLNLTNHLADDRNPDWPARCGPGAGAAQPESQSVGQPTLDNVPILLGYAGDDPWQSQRKENFLAACNELGIECILGDLPELIEKGVGAVVLNSNNITVPGNHNDILKARDRGIPVFILDAETITHGSYSITVDHHRWAAESVEWMFEKMGGKGEFAFFDFQFHNEHGMIIHDMLDKYPGINLVAEYDGKFDQQNVENEAVNLMRNHPNLGAVWTSEAMPAVIWGLKGALSPQDKFPLVLCEPTKDGLAIWKTLQEEYPNFTCLALSNPPGIAYDAVYAAYYLLSGKSIDPQALGGKFGQTLYVEIPMVKQENLAEYLEKIAGEADDYILDERMSPQEILETWFLD
jgi:ABC-type sugar transport system substrate-binding protein